MDSADLRAVSRNQFEFSFDFSFESRFDSDVMIRFKHLNPFQVLAIDDSEDSKTIMDVVEESETC